MERIRPPQRAKAALVATAFAVLAFLTSFGVAKAALGGYQDVWVGGPYTRTIYNYDTTYCGELGFNAQWWHYQDSNVTSSSSSDVTVNYVKRYGGGQTLENPSTNQLWWTAAYVYGGTSGSTWSGGNGIGADLHTSTSLQNTVNHTYGFSATHAVYFDATMESYGGCYIVAWQGLLPY